MRTNGFKKLNQNFSEILKSFKDHINNNTSHGNIYVTHFTIDLDTISADGDQFRGSFFDNLEVNETRAYLMNLTRLVVIIVETMRRANEKSQGLVFEEAIEERLERYARVVDGYREALGEIMQRSKAPKV